MQSTSLIALIARGLQVLNGLVILVCSILFLSQSSQGLLLTLNSIAAIQVIFELGFSSVVLQYVAHERVYLTYSPGASISGDSNRMDSLRAVFNVADKWFTRASLGCAVTLAIGGYEFFKGVSGTDWVLPLIILTIGVPLSLFQQKFWITLEGLGCIDLVVRYRVVSYFLSCIIVPVFFMSGFGLLTPAVSFFCISVASIFLKKKTKDVWIQLNDKKQYLTEERRMRNKAVFKDMLSLQGKVSISYIAGYFMFQAITPITYRTAGPDIAAIVGLGVSVILIMTNVLAAVMQVRIPYLMQKIGQKNLGAYYVAGERILFDTLSLGFGLSVIGLIILYVLNEYNLYKIATRLPDIPTYLCFVCVAMVSQVISVQATLTRLFKSEPYLWYSVAIAIVMVVVCLEGARTRSVLTIAALCFGVMLCIALPWSTIIYRREKKRRLNVDYLHSNI